jgi:hypothetical protein
MPTSEMPTCGQHVKAMSASMGSCLLPCLCVAC